MKLEEAIRNLKDEINVDKNNLPIAEANEYEEERTLMLNRIEAKETLLNHLTKQEKRISDIEFALMDMVLQFADESKDSINTMGLSALETAFSELDFDNPMPIKKVHEQYKKLAKQYFEKKAEESK